LLYILSCLFFKLAFVQERFAFVVAGFFAGPRVDD
jgi:hypothetical protein